MDVSRVLSHGRFFLSTLSVSSEEVTGVVPVVDHPYSELNPPGFSYDVFSYVNS